VPEISRKKVFLRDVIAPKKESVILHRERNQPPVDDARSCPSGCSAKGLEGCGRRFLFVLQFVFCAFPIAAPFA
jgi:hypothetical protein